MARKAKPRRPRKTQRRRARRATTSSRKVAVSPNKPQRARKRLPLDLQIAVRDMSRGRSLTATAQSLEISSDDLRRRLKQRRLLKSKRKGRRWVIADLPRRVPVMTGGRFRVLTVRGYAEARLVGEHHNAAGMFVRTNDINLITPFRGQTVQALNGRRYVLETDPNELHRIAAMDSPPFYEIYEITSNT